MALNISTAPTGPIHDADSACVWAAGDAALLTDMAESWTHVVVSASEFQVTPGTRHEEPAEKKLPEFRPISDLQGYSLTGTEFLLKTLLLPPP
jgi:hypothetical protein